MRHLCMPSLIPPHHHPTFPVRVTSPVIATSGATGVPIASERSAVMRVQPAEGPSLGVAPDGLRRGTRVGERIRRGRRDARLQGS
jgi:hypothetical protein